MKHKRKFQVGHKLRALLVVAVVLSVGITTGLLVKRMTVGNIVCRSQYGYCPQGLENDLQKVLGNNLISAKKSSRRIIDDHQEIAESRLIIKPPGTVIVEVVLKKGEIALVAGDQYYVLSRTGEVISVNDETGLKSLKLPVGYVINRTSNDKIIFYNEILTYVENLYGFREAVVDDQGFLVVNLESELKVIFPSEGEARVLVGALRLVIDQFNRIRDDEKLPEPSQLVLDLRYRNAVISRRGSEN